MYWTFAAVEAVALVDITFLTRVSVVLLCALSAVVLGIRQFRVLDWLTVMSLLSIFPPIDCGFAL
jgi:hypothetical protein